MTQLLVVFDVDSTLIRDEVIELLAELAGKRDEVAAVTASAMAGEIDFTESLVERVSTLAGLPDSVFTEVFERITVTPGAKELIAAIHHAGGKVAAVSGGFSQVLEPLAKLLDLDFGKANHLEVVDGKLTGRVIGSIIDRDAKQRALLEWAEATNTPIDKTVAVGDGANDLGMMSVAGLSIAFTAKPVVREFAQIVVDEPDLTQLIEILQLN